MAAEVTKGEQKLLRKSALRIIKRPRLQNRQCVAFRKPEAAVVRTRAKVAVSLHHPWSPSCIRGRSPNLRFEFPATGPAAILAAGSQRGPMLVRPETTGLGGGFTFAPSWGLA